MVDEEADADGRADGDGFRRRIGFLALMGIAFTATVYLMTLLRPVLQPFLFALFVVMGLHPLARLFESFILCLGRFVCGCDTEDRTANARHWRRRANHTGPRSGRRGSAGGAVVSASSDPELLSSPTSGADGELSLSLDEEEGEKEEPFWRVTEQPDVEHVCSRCCACIARALSVMFALALVLGALFGFAMLIIHAAVHVEENFKTYEEGARRAVQNIKLFFGRLFGKMPPSVADKISDNALAGVKAIATDVVAQLLSHTGKILVELLMLALYVMFWLCTPMPLNTKTEQIFRRYLMLKGGACMFYGVSVGVMLFILNINLAIFFGLMSFFFSFIPEVGAFIAMVLPVPFILFDTKLASPFLTLFIATVGQLGLKFVFANIIEVKLVEHDATMKMHPVVTLLALSFFGFIWGPTGMLLSVPLMTYMKVVILSDVVPPSYRDPILVILEGDRRAPERHLRRAAAGASSGKGLSSAGGSAPPSSAQQEVLSCGRRAERLGRSSSSLRD